MTIVPSGACFVSSTLFRARTCSTAPLGDNVAWTQSDRKFQTAPVSGDLDSDETSPSTTIVRGWYVVGVSSARACRPRIQPFFDFINTLSDAVAQFSFS